MNMSNVTTNTVNTTSFGTNESNKFKTYLIEKLLNETPPPSQQPPSMESGQKKSTDEEAKIANVRSESKEDLASETGTYTIDENPDIAVTADLDDEPKHVVEIRESPARPTLNAMEIITARAAIDEKFGIVANGSEEHEQAPTMKTTPTKRSPQKVVRLRNKTYSLTKDVLDAAVSTTATNSTDVTMVSGETNPVKDHTEPTMKQQQPFLLSSSSASSSSTSMLDSNARLKKTTTYEVIAATTENSTPATSARTVATEMLLGDTEKLIEQLKKRRMEKKHHVKPTTTGPELNNNNNNNNNLSSSSASSSSTNLSNKQTGQSWTIPSHDDDDPTASTRATVDFDAEAPSTRHKTGTGGLAFDFIMYNDHLQHGSHRQHTTSSPINRSLPHETVDTESSVSSTNPSVASSAAFSSLTLTKRFELKRSQLRHHKTDDAASSCVSTSGETAINSPKSNATSALSLGAKIQTKAKENQVEQSPPQAMSSSSSSRRRSSETGLMQTNLAMTPPTPVQYTNRTLFLRQQTAKAKRNSLEKSQVRSSNDSNDSNSYRITSSSKTTTNGILKKPTTPPTQPPILNSVSRSKTASSNLKSTSRSNSRTRSPFGSSNSLMTSSLNLPANTSLPTTITSDSFYKRKNYDPVKAVELDKLKRQHQQQLLPSAKSKQSPLMNKKNLNTSSDKLAAATGDHLSLVNMENNNNDDLSDFSFQSLSSQFSSLSVDTSRKNKGEKIVVSPTSSLKTSSRTNGESLKLNRLSLARTMSFRTPTKSSAESDKKPAVFDSRRSTPVKQITGNSTTRSLNTSSEQQPANDNLNDYEKIMQSTLQRLCIKLIQMSTGVLDKIGDNSTRTICDSIQYPNTSELERMQILAKLVHSIQLVHDHIEFIDTTLFNTHKSEDNYIKELSKIRKEVDILKQSAALNSPSTAKLRDN